MSIEKIWHTWADANTFCGVFSVVNETTRLFEKCQGFRNRSEELPNTKDTAFGIASGTKLFTALGICKLIDDGKLSLHDTVWNLLPYNLGTIPKQVTIQHLLTHTSGIGDYIDEESPSVSEDILYLYKKHPVYLWENLSYYLPMFIQLPPKFEPGLRFSYSNAGFVLLGLVIESITQKSYQQYITDKIIRSYKLTHTGFYRTDMLPPNTAHGYIKESDVWHTNIFRIPIIGGSDGGLYTCAEDLRMLWSNLFAGNILSNNMLQLFLQPHVRRDENKTYGLGIYRFDSSQNAVYYALGSDFGVDFFTAYFPKQKIVATALANCEVNTYSLLEMLFNAFL